MKKTITTLWAAILIIVGFTCQNPFATREPEPPQTGQSNWIQPTSPTYVLVNLKNAVSEKNKSNYLRCLADTGVSEKEYRFLPEPAVANANPGVFWEWGKEAESNYINQMYSFLPADSSISVTFSRLKETTYQDSVILLQTYQLNFDEKCIDDCMRRLEGQAEFRLIRTADDFWYIYRWSDYSTSDKMTWSALKARFGK